MVRTMVLCFCVVMFSAVMAAAQETANDKESDASVVAAAQEVNADEQSEAKELSGMSIVGNDEAPKSLYIVPWKGSELGAETGMDAILSESDAPVDRDVFKRQLEFYQVSTKR